MCYVYIVLDGLHSAKCKVGITDNPKNRIRGYQTASPDRSFTYHWMVECPDRATAKRLEKATLQAAREAGWGRVTHEWVEMSPSIVQSLVEGEAELLDIKLDEGTSLPSAL